MAVVRSPRLVDVPEAMDTWTRLSNGREEDGTACVVAARSVVEDAQRRAMRDGQVYAGGYIERMAAVILEGPGAVRGCPGTRIKPKLGAIGQLDLLRALLEIRDALVLGDDALRFRVRGDVAGKPDEAGLVLAHVVDVLLDVFLVQRQVVVPRYGDLDGRIDLAQHGYRRAVLVGRRPFREIAAVDDDISGGEGIVECRARGCVAVERARRRGGFGLRGEMLGWFDAVGV